MKIMPLLSNFANWLNSTEMFARPSKQIPGEWHLFEYYTEPGNELIHFKEEQLKKENLYWKIDFKKTEQVVQNANIILPFRCQTGKLNWNITGIYITITNPGDNSQNVTFRFFVTNEELRLLKKDTSGKIEFFGFFKRPDSKSQ